MHACIVPHKHLEMQPSVSSHCYLCRVKTHFLVISGDRCKLLTTSLKVDVLMRTLKAFFTQRANQMQGHSDFSAHDTKLEREDGRG